jgi:hypothetical protein
MAAEPSFPEVPEPDPPNADEVERMRAHRRDEHGEDFDLRRDVSFAGNPSETAPITFVAATPASGPKYRCEDCEGQLFLLPDPYIGTPERREHLRSFDRDLRTLLAGVDPEDQDEFIDRYERRRLGALLPALAPHLAAVPTKRGQATADRIMRCQEFVQKRRLAGRTVDEALSDLTDLHQTNLKLYREIVGDATLYAAGTFYCYYKELPAHQKKIARETSRRLRASGEVKPKYGTKFTG